MSNRSPGLPQLLRELQTIAARSRKPPRKARKLGSGRGLTARQIMRKTPRKTRARAEYVRVRKVKPKRGSGRYTLIATTTERGHATERQPHRQIVSIISPKGERNIFDPHTRLKISCDCSNFKFVWEYALWKKGAADIIYSNGDPPEQTNPRLVPGACKHFYALFTYLKARS